jgi:Zn-dependent peptidase ImmA (M78 family)
MTDGEARVQAVIDGLDYDFKQFSVSHFIQHLEALRARDIILRSVPFDQGLHGFWVRAETADYVFFNRRTHDVHQVHHILHELGHMVLGHRLRDLSSFLPPVLVVQLRASISAALQGHYRR